MPVPSVQLLCITSVSLTLLPHLQVLFFGAGTGTGTGAGAVVVVSIVVMDIDMDGGGWLVV